MTASLVPSRLVKIAATSSAAINVSLNATDFSSKSPGFILASAEKNVINSEPEALSSREVHLHITLDLPSTEHLPNLQQRKSQQLKQKQPSLNQLETINAVSQNRLVNQQPIPERPRRRRRQDSPRPQLKLNHLPRPQHRRQGVPVPKTKGFPQDTDRCNHITNAPGYVTPFKVKS
ncbi:hypothetical protein FBU30_011186 [Linnemannia zychae]|nr:hypothetical protein FBU30_011186 [Linnemannia zychae]